MEAHLGYLVSPLVGLGLEITEVAEGSQGPEVVPDLVTGPLFHLALFLGLGHVAGHRGDVKGPEKFQKVLVKAHQGALSLDDRREQVVMDEFFGGALEKVERIQEASVQGVLALRVGKLQGEQTAMTFNDRQTVEFSRRVAISKRTEMPPVGLALHAWRRFEAEDGRQVVDGQCLINAILLGDVTYDAVLLELWPREAA